MPDLSLTVLQNATLLLSRNYAHNPHPFMSSLAFHDLTTNKSEPTDSRATLGLGLKFIPSPKKTSPAKQIESALSRFERNLWLKCFFAGEEDEDSEHKSSKLYVKSKWTPPAGLIPLQVLKRLAAFRRSLLSLFTRRPGTPNLSRKKLRHLRQLQNDQEILTVNCDKNLGLARRERRRYVEDMFEFHLNDISTYELLSPAEAESEEARIKEEIEDWINKYCVDLGKDVTTYLRLQLAKNRDPFSFAYQLYKIHKEQLKTRMIISGSGSLLHDLGFWVQEQLQAVATKMPAFFKSSYILKEMLSPLEIPPGAVMFTADCTSMYTNINTEVALELIGNYLRENEELLECDVDVLIDALKLVMNNMIFQFGDLFYRQTTGTAMGVPPAVDWANIYYGLHEMKFLEDSIVKPRLYSYKRFVDDIHGIWIPHEDPETDERHWAHFVQLVNDFHGMEWTFSERDTRVEFMDLDIEIEDGSVVTRVFEKPMALHQYLPPHSAHPPGNTPGLVIGQVLRYHQLSTRESDAQDQMRKLYKRLLARGHTREILLPLFRKGLHRARAFLKLPLDERLADSRVRSRKDDSVFLILPYHPDDPKSYLIQSLWQSVVAQPYDEQPLSEISSLNTSQPIGVNRLIIGYRRHQNIGNLLSLRRFDKLKGPSVSSYNLHNRSSLL